MSFLLLYLYSLQNMSPPIQINALQSKATTSCRIRHISHPNAVRIYRICVSKYIECPIGAYIAKHTPAVSPLFKSMLCRAKPPQRAASGTYRIRTTFGYIEFASANISQNFPPAVSFAHKHVANTDNICYNIPIGKIKNSVKAGRLCCHLLNKGVIAMDFEYIISFMIILLLLVISIKK